MHCIRDPTSIDDIDPYVMPKFYPHTRLPVTAP
jgi:hypothetical protein